MKPLWSDSGDVDVTADFLALFVVCWVVDAELNVISNQRGCSFYGGRGIFQPGRKQRICRYRAAERIEVIWTLNQFHQAWLEDGAALPWE